MQIILSREGRQPRQPGRRRQGQGRLRAQLPDPGQAARRATEAAIKEFEARRADLEKAAADKLAAAQALREQLAGKVVRITQKAGVDGRLFGSVTNADIAEGLTKLGFAIAKSQVRLPNGPLKVVGEHAVSVSPHTDVVVEVTVQVVAQAD